MSDKVYGGRTKDLPERHRQHFFRIANSNVQGQLPAYAVMRRTCPDGWNAATAFFMLPVVVVPGGTADAVIFERVFLNGWVFKLNTPHVHRHLHGLGYCNLPMTSVTVHRTCPGPGRATPKSRPLARRRSSRNDPKPSLCFPKKPKSCTTLGRICCALMLEGRDAATKHGLKLLHVTRSRLILLQAYGFAGQFLHGCKKSCAMKLIRSRSRKVGLQLPLRSVTVRLPWCGSVANESLTRAALKEFVLTLFRSGVFQASVFTNGRLRVRIVWKPVQSLLAVVRTAHKFNKRLDSKAACPCVCQQPHLVSFPRVTGPDGNRHCCAKQADIPWSPEFKFLSSVPVQTRLLPDNSWTVSCVSQGLSDMACKLRDPFDHACCRERVADLVRTFTETLVSSWGYPVHANSPWCGGYLTVRAADEISRVCKGLWVEVLDKNPSSLVALCPALAKQLADSLFQSPSQIAYPCGSVFRSIRPVILRVDSMGSQLPLPIGSIVHLVEMGVDGCMFQEGFATKSDVTHCFEMVGGQSFRFDVPDWVSVSDITIPGLRPDLQPGTLISKHATVWRSMRGTRSESWTPARIVPKDKNLCAARPLGDQTVCRLALLFRVPARFLVENPLEAL